MPRVFALLLSLAIVFVGILKSLPLIREKAVQKRVQLELLEALRAEEIRARDLSARIIAVKTDPATVERLAREKFGLARPGEVVFKFRADWSPSIASSDSGRSRPHPNPLPSDGRGRFATAPGVVPP
jgi:hypothetical protein